MTDNDRLIGRVLAIESEKILVELEKDSKSLTKSFVTGTYPIARINSYVIIPVGSVGIVGIVTKVSMAKENVDLTPEATLTLPSPKRTISIVMVGSITRNEKKLNFEFGISQYPSLDNPVWFILEDELDAIFDKQKNINYFVELGQSTAYPEYEVKVNPDKLFSRHLGVIGNTGAGKSCTIASLLQTILNNDDVVKGKGAHFIIFDTNGEYNKAFENSKNFEMLHIDQDSLKIPYWLMNLYDFRNIFQASEGTQIPVLIQSLISARNNAIMPDASIVGLTNFIQNKIRHYGNIKDKPYFIESLNKIQEEVKSFFIKIVGELEEVEPSESLTAVEIEHLKNLGTKNTIIKIQDSVKKFREEKINEIKDEFIKSAMKLISGEEIHNENIIDGYDADSPHYFDILKFRTQYLENVLDEFGGNIRDKCSYMILRIDRFLRDSRYDFLFHNFKQNYEYSLSNFLRLCFGKMMKSQEEIVNEEDKDFYFYSKYLKNLKGDPKSNYQVIIFDLCLIPSDILQNVTALLGRLILEFLQRIEKVDEYNGKDVRGKFPVVLVLEEAHNYIPQSLPIGKESVSKEIFERIAREGRKYGLSLVVSSQRPSELSKTVLSQCNSFIVHRIQNPEDQEYVKKLLPSVSKELLNQLPIMSQGIALVFGDCVRAPMQVKIKSPNPTPKSSDPEYWKHWTNQYSKDEFSFNDGEPNFEQVSNLWEGKNKDEHK